MEKREKQIQQAFLGFAGMYGSMQGIVGSTLPELKGLNLPELTDGETIED